MVQKEQSFVEKAKTFLQLPEVAAALAGAGVLAKIAWDHRQQLVEGLEKLSPEVAEKVKDAVREAEQLGERIRDARHNAPNLPPH